MTSLDKELREKVLSAIHPNLKRNEYGDPSPELEAQIRRLVALIEREKRDTELNALWKIRDVLSREIGQEASTTYDLLTDKISKLKEERLRANTKEKSDE